MPARKAPSAIDTPNTTAEPTAIPSARVSTASVNNSRDRVAATRSSSQGITRLPTSTVNATSAATFSSVSSSAMARWLAPPPPRPKTAGSSTRATTVKRSSTTSQPTAICPVGVCRSRLSARMRTSTTVLATASAMPKTMPDDHDQPNSCAITAPSAVATRLCATAPGTATRRTASSSSTWNCSPTPNISRMTPTSASCSAIAASATKPGVCGPTRVPARR